MLSLQNGNTALICASDNGHTDVVQLLLEAEANTDITDTVSYKMRIDIDNFKVWSIFVLRLLTYSRQSFHFAYIVSS